MVICRTRLLNDINKKKKRKEKENPTERPLILIPNEREKMAVLYLY